MDTKHTATPWAAPTKTYFVGGDGNPHAYAGITITGPDGKSICAFPSSSKRDPRERAANIEFIVRACNRDHLFDDLVDMLAEMTDDAEHFAHKAGAAGQNFARVEKARALLAKVGEAA